MEKRKGRTLEQMLELNARGLTDIAEFKAGQKKSYDCSPEHYQKLCQNLYNRIECKFRHSAEDCGLTFCQTGRIKECPYSRERTVEPCMSQDEHPYF